jgi:hypothetical protein
VVISQHDVVQIAADKASLYVRHMLLCFYVPLSVQEGVSLRFERFPEFSRNLELSLPVLGFLSRCQKIGTLSKTVLGPDLLNLLNVLFHVSRQETDNRTYRHVLLLRLIRSHHGYTVLPAVWQAFEQLGDVQAVCSEESYCRLNRPTGIIEPGRPGLVSRIPVEAKGKSRERRALP